MRWGWLSYLLLVPSIGCHAHDAASASAAPPTPPLFVDAGAHSALLDAVAHADIAKLQRFAASKDPIAAALGHALIERARGDFTRSEKSAASCLEQTLPLGSAKVQIALICAQVRASNVLLQGDVKAWARMTIRDWGRLLPALQAAIGKPNLTSSPLELARGIAKNASPAPTLIQWRAPSGPLRLIPDTEELHVPGKRLFVPVTINGRVQRWILDTGVQMSSLSRADAKALGLHADTVRMGSKDDVGAEVHDIGVTDVKRIEVSGLLVQDARMVVVHGDISIIGMDLIGRMGPVTEISTKELSFPTRASGCASPLVYELDFTGLGGNARPLMQINAQGENWPAFLDTGNNASLVLRSSDPAWGKRGTLKEVSVSTLNQTYKQRYIDTTTTLLVDGHGVEMPLEVTAPNGFSEPWTVGSGALLHANLVLDHANGTACLRQPR
jgi:hypothetical protein